MSEKDEYPTVRILNRGTYAEFVIANPNLKSGDYIPIKEIEEIIRDMNRYGDPNVDRFASVLAGVVKEHQGQ